jgi:DNA-binding MarR family transcriptional regulator
MPNVRPAQARGSGLDDALEFMRILCELDHELQSTSKHMESRLGITGPQRLVIRILGSNPRISAGALATILHVHPSTLTGVLQRLEARRIVERTSDPEDGRRVILELTAKGRRLDQVHEGTVEHAVRTLLSKTPRTQIVNARRVLAALSTQLTRLVESA